MLPNWLQLEDRTKNPVLHLFGPEETVIEGTTYLIAPYFYAAAPLSRRKYLINKDYGLQVKLTIPITDSMADQLMTGPLLLSIV